MSIIVNNIKLNLNENISKLKRLSAQELRVKESDIKELKVLRESIDARKSDIKLVYRLLLSLNIDEDKAIKKSRSKNVSIYKEQPIKISSGNKELNNRIIVVGSGPAGLFCAYILAKFGYKPLVLERGEDVDNRKKSIDNFWKTGGLNTDSNVQFGEGGAGTFSDGKLTTRIKDPRVQNILDIFVKNGAPSEISYSHKPHIGTDILIDVIRSIRKEIIEMGGEFKFSTKMQNINVKDGRVTSISAIDSSKYSNNSNSFIEIDTENVILAIGHSARDTYEMLYDSNIEMEQKPFAIGVRVEHTQDLIDSNQYGTNKNHPKLKASEYKLTHRAKNGRSCYSFCMCPGGTVVASSSEAGMLVTNGMSEHARDKENANSAIVVSIKEEDFKSKHPLAGIEFQRKHEQLAFKLGGSNYKAPVQLLKDFNNNKSSNKIGTIIPSYTRGYVLEDINKCLPDYVTEAIKESMEAFDKKIKGFANPDTVLTGIETRTSAPVRILRDENFNSNVKGLYPCGEGAGYAGGIVSAAVDGIKVAETLIKTYAKPK